MKRRLLPAMLSAIALVVLVGPGDATSATPGASVTRGQPWAGASGVTESVASLKARQKKQDIEQGGRPLGIRFKPEPGEPPSSGKAAGTADEGASGGGASGEAGTAPKLQAPAALNQRTGQQAVGPASSFTAGTSFLGAQVSESGFVPPDSMGSVGPTQVLVYVNGRIKVFDKQGNLGGLNVSDSTFWSSVDNGSSPTDPGVEYDRLTGHWIISAVNTTGTNNRVMLAVSSGPTITDSSSFTFFQFAQNAPTGGAGVDDGLFADYPQLGVDANAVYVGVNMFSGNSFAHTTAFVIRKSSVLGGGPIVVTAFRNLTNGSGGQGPDSPQPAQDMDPGVGEGYIVGPDNQVANRVDVMRITNPGTTPSISANMMVTVPTTAAPLSVPVEGSHHNSDALDERLFGAMVGRAPDGSLSLWTAHNIRVDSSGTGSATGDRDGARWYQLGTLSTTPSLIQSGTLFDSSALSPRYFWIPSIAMNGQGNASLNASVGGSSEFAEIASSGHLASDPAGTTDPPSTVQTSSSSYNIGLQNGIYRWGDYSQTVVDPTDNQTFWTFQEYTNAKDSWGLRVIKLRPPPPATPSVASPSSVPTGQSSATVNVTGTSTNGSGFFDPGSDPGGPGWANHIAASVTGGVTVNSVTYVDPTHVTLDLNTQGATAGSQDITITNPDGQSTTASNALVVGTDTTPPAPPTFSGTSPTSPANNNSPKLIGTAEAGSTVRLYTNSSCSGSAVATGTAATFASPGIAASVAANSTTTFYATATDVSNNTSDCSSTLASGGSISYTSDSIAPTAPSIASTSPASPSPSTTPSVIGTSSADTATVQIFTQSNCGGSVQASGPKATFESTGVQVTVGSNAATTLSAKALDAAGNASSCSNNLSYTNDSNPPAAPSSLSVSPASPANNNGPAISGSAESGSTVKLFTNSSCSGSPTATGTAAAFASPGITVSVADNTTTTFYATATDAAGNTSVCSTSNVTYQENSMLPTAPTLTGTLPGSPANDNSPLIFGTAPAGTTVKLYDNPSCVLQAGSPPAPSGSSAGFASPGITAPVADNTTTTFYATATDNTTSNVSACSTTSVTFVEDSTPPSVSVTGGPSGTTGDATPTFTFTGGDAVGPVSFQCSIDNGIPGFRACSGPGNSDTQPSPLGDGSYTFRVRASDGAGNAATATRSFTVQTASTPPGPPSNVFSVAGTTLNKKKGTATLNLILPGPGHLTGTGDGVSTISESVAGGPAQLPVRAVGKKKKKLSQNGKVTLGVTVTYTPTGGKSGTKSVSVKLKKKQ